MDKQKFRELADQLRERSKHHISSHARDYDYHEGMCEAYKRASELLEELLSQPEPEQKCSLCGQTGTHLCEPFRQPEPEAKG